MKNILFFSFFLIGMSSMGQSISWSSLIKNNKGRVAFLLPIDGSNFYSLTQSNSALKASYYLNFHQNFQILNSNRIQAKVGNSMAMIEEIFTLKKTAYVLLSQKENTERVLYLQKYDETCLPVGEVLEIARYETPKIKLIGGQYSYYNLLLSENEEFFCIEYFITGNKEESEKLAYQIYSSELELISSGDYQMPYKPESSNIAQRYLSNTGDYFLAVNLYQEDESKKLFKNPKYLIQTDILQITPTEIEKFELHFNKHKMHSFTFSSDNNQLLSFNGFYNDKNDLNPGIKGTFCLKLDFNSKEILTETYTPFSEAFIKEDLTGREIAKIERKKEKGQNIDPLMQNYKVVDMITQNDGSTIGIMEKSYVVTRTYTDSRGGSRTVYYYHFEDLIIYKNNLEGQIEWIKRIEKNQITSNDGGYYSSIVHCIQDQKLTLFFNDSKQNYDENGNFIRLNENMSLLKKQKTLAQVNIQLSDGTVSRKEIKIPELESLIPIPRISENNKINREILFIAQRGSKLKYGLLKY
jgi:hypothetical protein